MTTWAFLGLGEAGSSIAADLAAAGATVRGWDPAVDSADGVEVADGPAAAVAGADVVVSLNSAADALDAADSVAGALGAGQVYADGNTAAPGRKRQVADCLAGSGAAVADVALLAPVPGRGAAVPMLASGPGATRFAALAAPLGMDVEDGGPEIGFAASRKLVRSVFFKGMAAAVVEALAAAQRLDCEDWLLAQVEQTLADADAGLATRLVEGSHTHAVRRAHEMAAATAMLDEIGVPSRVSAAARAWLEELGEGA